MALTKDKLLESGVTINYWHIKKLEHLVKNGHPYIKFYLCGYVYETAKDNDCCFMESHSFTYIGEEYADFESGTLSRNEIYEKAYEKIKESKMIENEETGEMEETNFFVDAVDLL